jgi:hypothetical protein
MTGETAVGLVRVLFVSVSEPAKVDKVPVVGRVTLVAPVAVRESANAPRVVNDPVFAIDIVASLGVITTPLMAVAVASPIFGLDKVGDWLNTKFELVVPVVPAALVRKLSLVAVVVTTTFSFSLGLVRVLLRRVSVVSLPTKVSVLVGRVRVPVFTIVEMMGDTKVGLVANTRSPVPVSPTTAVARLAAVGVARNAATPDPNPLIPVDTGRPVALVNTAALGVPKSGVTRAGLVARTRAPVPVSSVTAAAKLALLGVARNAATLEPNPLIPVETGSPVAFVNVTALGTPRSGVISDGDVANTRGPEPVSSVTAAARFALLGVARKAETPEPRPDIPVDTGRPVAFVRISELGVPRSGVTSTGLVSVLFVSVSVVFLPTSVSVPSLGNVRVMALPGDPAERVVDPVAPCLSFIVLPSISNTPVRRMVMSYREKGAEAPVINLPGSK